MCLRRLAAVLLDRRLKSVHITLEHDIDQADHFHVECAERVVLVFPAEDAFVKTKQHPFPQHVHVFCGDIGETVSPDDFYPWKKDARFTLSNWFGVAQLRSFNDRLLIPDSDVSMGSRCLCSECDVSFMTRITSLQVYGVVGCSLTVPTTVVSLVLKYDVRDVFVSGTENLTSLEVPNDTITTTESPNLRELKWPERRCRQRCFHTTTSRRSRS